MKQTSEQYIRWSLNRFPAFVAQCVDQRKQVAMCVGDYQLTLVMLVVVRFAELCCTLVMVW
jgi:hypothetical protein